MKNFRIFYVMEVHGDADLTADITIEEALKRAINGETDDDYIDWHSEDQEAFYPTIIDEYEDGEIVKSYDITWIEGELKIVGESTHV